MVPVKCINDHHPKVAKAAVRSKGILLLLLLSLYVVVLCSVLVLIRSTNTRKFLETRFILFLQLNV